MNRNYFEQPDGYRETIERGIAGVQRFRGGLTEGNLSREESIQRLKTELAEADAVVIGAGAGLSTSAGLPGQHFGKDHSLPGYRRDAFCQSLLSENSGPRWW